MTPSRDISRLIEIMAALRTPVTGCPWDLEQNFATIAPYTIEEAHEVVDAIDRGDLDDLREELGDLLLQVVFHAQMAEEQNAFGGAGAHKDGWLKGLAPKAWETPEEILVTKEFQEVLKGCLSRLPLKVAQAFVMREIDDVSSEEICKDLGVSPNNVWVMLHRARMALRRCLEVHWFSDKSKDE